MRSSALGNLGPLDLAGLENTIVLNIRKHVRHPLTCLLLKPLQGVVLVDAVGSSNTGLQALALAKLRLINK
jgi:hypothetical protein